MERKKFKRYIPYLQHRGPQEEGTNPKFNECGRVCAPFIQVSNPIINYFKFFVLFEKKIHIIFFSGHIAPK